jgi:hypothetical protein
MNAIALLTVAPSHDLLEFYSGFERLGYRVFVVVDDNNFKLGNAEVKVKNAGVSLIQFDDNECRTAGFFDLNPVIEKRSRCAAWEKALYYFCRRDLSHDNVWFIEDDVFVPNHETILNIDRKYGKADIISVDNAVNEYGVLDDWYWWRFVPKTILRPPWAKSMVCTVRLSRKILTAFDSLIRSNKDKLRIQNAVIKLANITRGRPQDPSRTYFFIEYTFHTLALHCQLSVITAQELSGVVWRKEWDVSEMNPGTIYHPLKDRDLHKRYRQILQSG